MILVFEKEIKEWCDINYLVDRVIVFKVIRYEFLYFLMFFFLVNMIIRVSIIVMFFFIW